MQFKSKYKEGDTRTIKKFAFFPLKIYNKDNSYIKIWLEFYYDNQIYTSKYWSYLNTTIKEVKRG